MSFRPGWNKGVPRAAPGTLSPRQAEIVALRVAGLTSPEIAQRLGLAVTTVHATVQRARGKGTFVPGAGRGRPSLDADPNWDVVPDRAGAPGRCGHCHLTEPHRCLMASGQDRRAP